MHYLHHDVESLDQGAPMPSLFNDPPPRPMIFAAHDWQPSYHTQSINRLERQAAEHRRGLRRSAPWWYMPCMYIGVACIAFECGVIALHHIRPEATEPLVEWLNGLAVHYFRTF